MKWPHPPVGPGGGVGGPGDRRRDADPALTPTQAKPAGSPWPTATRKSSWLYPPPTPPPGSASWRPCGGREPSLRTPIDARPEIGAAAFPKETTAVPEVALALPGVGRRLGVPLYTQLLATGNPPTGSRRLMRRRPPPLAIVGGSYQRRRPRTDPPTQDHMGDVAEVDRPLLLLTTATGDRRRRHGRRRGIARSRPTKVYPQRTFRFCFTNRQMAKA